MRFDPEGHIPYSPAEVLAFARQDASRLINDVLWRATPKTFETYQAYRDFVDFVAGRLAVHPSCIIFRGSTRLGFSMTPKSGKIWTEAAPDSDVDLAIVDPDHFHAIDTEVRTWERRQRKNYEELSREDIEKFTYLEKNRASYCYRHTDLPDTPLVGAYKNTMMTATAPKLPGCGRDVTAFFYRDWWSLHAREERDIRDVVSRLRMGNLPMADDHPRIRPPDWSDADLKNQIVTGSCSPELFLSSMQRITDAGLAHLSSFPGLRKLWLDDMGKMTSAKRMSPMLGSLMLPG